MKKLIPVLIFVASCTSTKVASIASDKTPSTAQGFVYENDTVKITYRFWENKGRMEYDIYNKLNEPIYIDWKSSAYIPNDKKVSYWQDVTNTEGVYASSTYLVHGGVNSGGRSSTKAVRAERIAVIPPEAMITQKDYTLVNSSVQLPNGEYDKTNTPFRFRNYLSIATNEKFEGKVSTVNNTFYVSSVYSVKGDKYQKYKSQKGFYVPIKYEDKQSTTTTKKEVAKKETTKKEPASSRKKRTK